MNPAFRIWALAIAQCTAISLIACLSGGDPHFMLLILLIVGFASLGSLLGFFILYEVLRYLQAVRPVLWVCAIAGTSAIVVLNATCLIFFLDNPTSWSRIWAQLSTLLLLAALPLATALAGTAICYRQVASYCEGAMHEETHVGGEAD